MRLAMERGVPLEERHKVALGGLTDWEAARLRLSLVELQQSLRNTLVDLHCGICSADALRHRVDVTIHLSQPEAVDVKLDGSAEGGFRELFSRLLLSGVAGQQMPAAPNPGPSPIARGLECLRPPRAMAWAGG